MTIGHLHPRRRAATLLACAVVLPTLCVTAGCGGTASDASGRTTTTSTSVTRAPVESAAPTPTLPVESVPQTTVPAPTLPPPPGRQGVFSVAPGVTAVAGSGPLFTYTVEVEESLGLDPAEVAAAVDATLTDPRSWAAHGEASMQRVDSGARVRIIVASPPTVDAACLPLNTAGELSCRSGNKVNINSDRWLGATSDWTAGLDDYRSYVVNHEVGHALGHGHEDCPGAGSLAPLMMQQTKGLRGCEPNAWPYPL